jgi:hypothetical protein
MGLEDLLAEDTIQVQRPKTGQDSSGGATRSPWQPKFSSVPARVDDASSTQALRYAALAITVSHVVLTQQAGIQNGDRITTSDGKFLRVNAVQRVRSMAGLDGYWEIGAEEVLQ